MRINNACVAAGLLGSALAHPVEKRANTLPPVASAMDESVLQLALYLEHLELSLYTGGFVNFTDAQYIAEGFPPGFRENVGLIAQHEQVHSDTISAILTAAGYTPVPPCSYRFPYNSPTTFVELANAITSTGIGAYLGGASLLTDNPTLLTAASSIVTVEARHDAYLRAGVGGSPFPTAFDTALTGVYAYNIAQQFIDRCPVQLPLTILPKLTAVSPVPPLIPNPAIAAGSPLRFTFDPNTFFTQPDPNAPLYIGLINSVTNVTYTEAERVDDHTVQIPVPEGAGGAAFAVLTTFNGAAALSEDQLTQFGTLAGPAEVILS